jgi:putative transposase
VHLIQTNAAEDATLSQALRRAETIGRPLGDEAFLGQVQAIAGRDPEPRKRGPRAKEC